MRGVEADKLRAGALAVALAGGGGGGLWACQKLSAVSLISDPDPTRPTRGALRCAVCKSSVRAELTHIGSRRA